MSDRWGRAHVAVALLAWAMLPGVAIGLALVRALLVGVGPPSGGLGMAWGAAIVLLSAADLASCPVDLRGVSGLAAVLVLVTARDRGVVTRRVAWALSWLLHVAVVSRVGIATWAPLGVAAWLTLPWAMSPVVGALGVLRARGVLVIWGIAAGLAWATLALAPQFLPEAALAGAVGSWRDGLSLGGASLNDPARRVLARVDDPAVSRLRAVAYDRWDGERWHVVDGPADVVAPMVGGVSGWQRPLGGVLLTPGPVAAWTLAPRGAVASASGWVAEVPSAFPWQAVGGRARRDAPGPTGEALDAWRSEVMADRTYAVLSAASDLDAFAQGTAPGDCTHFATLGVLSARERGWTSRLVVGFAGGTVEEGARVFRAQDAHAWVEVVVDGVWQTLEVTPARLTQVVADDAAGTAQVAAPTAEAVVGSVDVAATEPPGPGSSTEAAGTPRWVSGAWALFALLLAAGGAAAARAWSTRPTGWQPIARRLARRASHLLRPTPAGTAAALRKAWGDDAAPVEAFVRALYAVRYGELVDPGLRRLGRAALQAVTRRTR